MAKRISGYKMDTPRNEIETIVWFSERHSELDCEIIKMSSSSFPDATIRRGDGIEIFVEFEFMSSSFIEHEHNPYSCDLIICWKDDFPIETDFPILELSSMKQYGSVANNNNREQILEYIEKVMSSRNKRRQLKKLGTSVPLNSADWRSAKHILSDEQMLFISQNSPNEVVERLSKDGIAITPRTASNWRIYAMNELGISIKK